MGDSFSDVSAIVKGRGAGVVKSSRGGSRRHFALLAVRGAGPFALTVLILGEANTSNMSLIAMRVLIVMSGSGGALLPNVISAKLDASAGKTSAAPVRAGVGGTEAGTGCRAAETELDLFHILNGSLTLLPIREEDIGNDDEEEAVEVKSGAGAAAFSSQTLNAGRATAAIGRVGGGRALPSQG